MSATLRVSDFAENKTLFSVVPPIINISARQHSVTIHFNRRTPSDYVSEAIRKAVKIHVRLPAGGILIFLTGQNEITTACKKLESRFGKRTLEDKKTRATRSGKKPEIYAHVEESHVVQRPDGQLAPILNSIELNPRFLFPSGNAETEEMGIDIDPLDIEQEVDGDDQADPDALDTEDENDADGTMDLDHSDGAQSISISDSCPF
jgi:ATP-dependent RNA helicase DHX37/DHR1